MCNEESVDWSYHWWGIEIEWKIDDERSQELQRAFQDYGSKPFELGSIAVAAKAGYVPGAVVYGVGLLVQMWGDDIDHYNDGCGIEVEQHFTPATGVIPWYTVSGQ